MHSNEEGMGGESVENQRLLRSVPPSGMESVSALADAELLTSTRRLVCQSNRLLSALLAHLAEVETRGLHRTRACASLYTYCIYELRMSEDAASRRVSAARLIKRFPLLFEAVQRGELHLTGVLVLGPHLTEMNVAGVLERAKFRTKKELLKLVRILSPLPDVPSRIEPLGLARPAHPFSRPTWSQFVASLCPVRELQPDERPGTWLATSDAVELEPGAVPAPMEPETFDMDGDEATGVEPAPARNDESPTSLSGPQRYHVQFTATEEYVALLEEAKALLAHARPSAELAEIHLRALRTLVTALKQRKYATRTPREQTAIAGLPAASNSPAPSIETSAQIVPERPFAKRSGEPVEHPRQRGRHVPAAVRRAVFERDEHRCSYVDARGVRCRETARLQFHHREPFARGGPTTTENLALFCTAHNALAAEQDFGRELVTAMREQPHFTERSLAPE